MSEATAQLKIATEQKERATEAFNSTDAKLQETTVVHTDKLETRDALLETNARLKATENRHNVNAYAYKALALEAVSKSPLGTGWATGSCLVSGMMGGDAEEVEGSMEWSRPPERQDALRKLDVTPSDDSPPWIMGSTNKVDVPTKPQQPQARGARAGRGAGRPASSQWHGCSRLRGRPHPANRIHTYLVSPGGHHQPMIDITPRPGAYLPGWV